MPFDTSPDLPKAAFEWLRSHRDDNQYLAMLWIMIHDYRFALFYADASLSDAGLSRKEPCERDALR